MMVIAMDIDMNLQMEMEMEMEIGRVIVMAYFKRI